MGRHFSLTLLIENVQRLVAVSANQLFAYGIDQQVHRLKGQRAKEYVFRAGNHNGGKRGASVLPLNPHPQVYREQVTDNK
jgi:hypothetical protein